MFRRHEVVRLIDASLLVGFRCFKVGFLTVHDEFDQILGAALRNCIDITREFLQTTCPQQRGLRVGGRRRLKVSKGAVFVEYTI